jgi:hypothetical protein
MSFVSLQEKNAETEKKATCNKLLATYCARESSLKNGRIIAKSLAKVFKRAFKQGKEKRLALKPLERMLQKRNKVFKSQEIRKHVLQWVYTSAIITTIRFQAMLLTCSSNLRKLFRSSFSSLPSAFWQESKSNARAAWLHKK